MQPTQTKQIQDLNTMWTDKVISGTLQQNGADDFMKFFNDAVKLLPPATLYKIPIEKALKGVSNNLKAQSIKIQNDPKLTPATKYLLINAYEIGYKLAANAQLLKYGYTPLTEKKGSKDINKSILDGVIKFEVQNLGAQNFDTNFDTASNVTNTTGEALLLAINNMNAAPVLNNPALTKEIKDIFTAGYNFGYTQATEKFQKETGIISPVTQKMPTRSTVASKQKIRA